jgi:hypothetical protein
LRLYCGAFDLPVHYSSPYALVLGDGLVPLAAHTFFLSMPQCPEEHIQERTTVTSNSFSFRSRVADAENMRERSQTVGAGALHGDLQPKVSTSYSAAERSENVCDNQNFIEQRADVRSPNGASQACPFPHQRDFNNQLSYSDHSDCRNGCDGASKDQMGQNIGDQLTGLEDTLAGWSLQNKVKLTSLLRRLSISSNEDEIINTLSKLSVETSTRDNSGA